MATLYDITLEGKLIEDILIANDGELTPELEERLDALLVAGQDKLEAAAKVVKNLLATSKAAKEEGKRLQDRAKSFESQADRLKDRMRIALDAAFNGKVKTPLFSIYTSAGRDSISFDLAEGFNFDHLRESEPGLVVTEYSLNKEKLIELHKGGDSLPEEITVTEKTGDRYCTIR